MFGIYTMVNLAATTAGRMVLTLGDANGYFSLCSPRWFIAFCLTANRDQRDHNTTPTYTGIAEPARTMEKFSIAVFAVLMVGVSNASFRNTRSRLWSADWIIAG